MKLPPPLSQAYDAWMAFSKVLGRIMSAIILTVLWVIGFGIYGIVLKIIALFLPRGTPATYWSPLPPPDADSLERQF